MLASAVSSARDETLAALAGVRRRLRPDALTEQPFRCGTGVRAAARDEQPHPPHARLDHVLPERTPVLSVEDGRRSQRAHLPRARAPRSAGSSRLRPYSGHDRGQLRPPKSDVVVHDCAQASRAAIAASSDPGAFEARPESA